MRARTAFLVISTCVLVTGPARARTGPGKPIEALRQGYSQVRGKINAAIASRTMRYNEFRAAKREVKQLTASSRAMQQVYDEAFKATKKASSLTNSLANLNFCTGAGNGLLAIGAAVPWLTGTAAAIGVGTGVGLKLHVRHRAHRAGRMAVLEKAFKNPAQRGALSVEARRYLQRNLIADQNKIVNAYRSTRKEASELRTAVRGNKKLLGHLERSLGQ